MLVINMARVRAETLRVSFITLPWHISKIVYFIDVDKFSAKDLHAVGSKGLAD